MNIKNTIEKLENKMWENIKHRSNSEPYLDLHVTFFKGFNIEPENKFMEIHKENHNTANSSKNTNILSQASNC